MKKIIAAAAAAAVILTGCTGQTSSHEYLFIEADSYIKNGDIDAAEKCILNVCRENSAKGEVLGSALSRLYKNGKLDFLDENFPAEEDIIFMGKPLSEYTSQELLEMTGQENKIGYREETGLSDELYSIGSDEAPAALPYGVEASMSAEKMYEAIGFSSELAEILDDIYYIDIENADGSFSVDAKRSQYAPFSQHPMEEWYFSYRKGRVRVTFSNYGEALSSCTVTVYF